jgi:hypothetical protein
VALSATASPMRTSAAGDAHAVGAFLRLEISQGEDPDGEPRAPFVAKRVGFDPTAYADVA